MQQPSNLDIIQTAREMRQEFATLLQNSGDRVDAVCRDMDARVDDLEGRWIAHKGHATFHTD